MPITDEIADNPAMRASLDAEAQEVKALREIKYGARATENYSLRGTRLGETPLGNLYADATLNGLRARNIDLDLALVHSGGIRADLYAGREITRLDLANIVMNAGKLEGEQQELVRVMMKGSEIQKGLEYGVRDMSAPRGQTLAQKAKALLGMTPQEHAFDPGGNLMQVAGMRYKFNLTRPHGDRVYNLELQGKDGALTPILPDKEYAVATRVHAVDKWHKNGVLGDVSLQEAYEGLNYEMLPISQVDLLADHIRGKVIDPKQFGAVEGRIRNRTPVAGEIPYRLGSYQLGPAAAGIADPHQ